MTPPPPPFGLGRSKGRVVFDPALDDPGLIAARTALSQGRWTDTRDLLARTGDDWDRRGHRLVVLGEGPSTVAWAEDWQLAEPDSADAAALLACATVFRVLAGKATPERAAELCQVAAGLAPADPTPWLALQILARHTGTPDDQERAFDQVCARHRAHHHAHHLMAACLSDRDGGSDGDGLYHEVYEFADWACAAAPPGSPLAVLPLVAHTERHRALALAGKEHDDPARSEFWRTWRARRGLAQAFDWWLEWDGRDHPRLYLDLNYLVHAQVVLGRTAEAAALFNRIGAHATRKPWSYPDRDPGRAFLAARQEALGPGFP
jgi:hypothetical protein